MKSIYVLLPVKALLNYREFDREKNPAPRIPFVQFETVDSMTEKIKAEGMTEALELSICNGLALLTDGNHRVVAVDRLGYSQVSVNVKSYTDEELSDIFYETTIKRFKPIQSDIKNLIISVI